MAKANVFNYVIGVFMVTLSIIGLNGCMYSRRTKKFYVNYFLVVWCISVSTLFITTYIRQFLNDIATSEELNLKNAVKLFYYMNIIGVSANYLEQLLNCKEKADFFNRVQLYETFYYLDIDTKIIKSSTLLILLKAIIFPIIIEITLIIRQLHDDEDKNLLWTIYTAYPLVLTNIIPNCLYAFFVVCRQFIIALNSNLDKLKREANLLQNMEQMVLHKNFYRMQKFCNLADKLDKLSEKYSIICSQTLSYIKLCSMPLIASLLCNLFGITAGLFQQYNALADTLINEQSYDVFNIITNGVFLIISFLEIALHSLIADQTIDAVRTLWIAAFYTKENIKDTGLILKSIKLDYVDVRFRQAVEKFSFQILVTDFKIQPMKLLNIDLSLLHGVLSAVTSFLLILIQSDLTLRFSLK